MDIAPDARKRLDDHIAESLQTAGGARGADTERELRSHLFEGAARNAEANHAPRIEVTHVEAAIADLGSAAQVSHEIAPHARPWMTRVPLNTRGWASLAFAGAGTFVAFAWVVTGLLCRFTPFLGDPETASCAAFVSPWAGFFLTATLAAALGIWLATRWIAIVAGTFLLLMPMWSIGAEFVFGTIAGLLLIAAAILMPRGPPRAAKARAASWKYLAFIPAGLFVGFFSEMLLTEVLGLELEGAQQFLPAMFATALVVWGLVALATRLRDVRLAAGTLAIVMVSAFVGFIGFFVASFAGSGCFPQGPGAAAWNDPELYDEFPDPGAGGVFTVTHTPAPVGLPLNNTTLDEKYGKGAWALTSVERPLEQDPGPDSTIQLTSGPTLSMRWSDEVPESVVRRSAERFLENTTALDASERADTVTQLLVARTSMGNYTTGDPATGAPNHEFWSASIRLPEAPTLQALWAREGSRGTDRVSGAQLSTWSFQFTYDTRAANGIIDGNPTKLLVDASGAAHFEYGDTATTDAATIHNAWNQTFQQLGFDEAPSDVTPTASGTRCVD